MANSSSSTCSVDAKEVFRSTTVGGESYVWEKFRERYLNFYTGGKLSRVQQFTIDFGGKVSRSPVLTRASWIGTFF